MKIDCDIIKDLLPLYHDGVCSVKSKSAIEEHLTECDNCNAELETMSMDIPLSTQAMNIEESQVIQKISRKWRTDILKSYLKSALITILVIAVVALILFLFIDIRAFYVIGGQIYE